MAEDDALPLVLQELGGRRRRLELRGADLPRGSGFLRFGGTTRKDITWYNGSESSTFNAFGPEPRELSFAGELTAGRQGRTSSLTPIELVKLIEDLRDAAEMVQVSWGQISKICAWDEVEFTVQTQSRVAYSMRFIIIAVSKPLDVVRIARRIRDVPTVASVLAQAGEILDALSTLPAGLGGDRIGAAITSVNQIVSTASAAGAVLDTLRGVSQQVLPGPAQSALRLIDSVRDHTRDLLETVGGLSWPGMLGGDSFGVLATAGIGALRVGSQVIALGASVLDLHARVRVLSGDTRQDAIFVAGASDTLRTIAQRFLGSPDRWTEIATANGLGTSFVDAGVELVIPGAGVGGEAAR